MEDNFSMEQGGGDGLGMIQFSYISCALYFCYYCISYISGHPALAPGGWGTPVLKDERVEEVIVMKM